MKLLLKYTIPALAAILLTAAYVTHASGPGAGIMLRNFPIDASGNKGDIPHGLAVRPSVHGSPVFVIVQFTDRFNLEARQRLSGMGVRFYGYIPENSFAARIPPGRRSDVESDPSVSGVYDYLPAYAIQEGILDRVLAGDAGELQFRAMAFDDEPLAPIFGKIESMGGTVEVVSDKAGLNGKLFDVTIDLARVPDMAAIDGVSWIEPKPVWTLFNDVTAPLIGADHAWTAPVPLDGTGQIVAVCDTGLDTGNTVTMHDDFKGNTSDGYTKLKATFAYGRTGVWNDPDGHGTHVAGSVLGTGSASSGLFKGMAHDARLVFQSVLNQSGGLSIPSLGSTTFPDAYGQGARIHNNSWGTLYQPGDYNSSSVAVDTFTWNNPDFVVVFAAGNESVDNSPSDGVVDKGSIIPPSTSKNAISVGASEHNRPGLGYTYGSSWPADFPNQPIYGDDISDDPYGMVAFSGRGPCDDGRIKPDVIAPGTHVISTKSSVSGATYWLSPSSYGYSPSYNNDYASNGGTSMAAPLVSGAAALVREYLANEGHADPSAALVKAMLVAGALDLTPGQYPSPYDEVTSRPDNSQGWGLVDLKNSLYPDAPLKRFYVDHASGIGTGGQETYAFSIADTSVPVRVNLAWSDYPSTTIASKNLVNDLNLAVTAPDGTVYHGNIYTGSASTPDPAGYDDTNNVEGVTIPAASLTTGSLTVTVSGYNVPQGPQPFAIVVNGGLSDPPHIDTVEPSAGVNNAETPVQIRGTNFQAGVTVTVGGEGCPVSFVTYSAITATVPYGLSAGAKDVSVYNTNGGQNTLAAGFTVTADTTAPGAPAGLSASPGDGFVNLIWNRPGDSDLLGYRVYYTTYSSTVGMVETHKVTGLANDVEYTFHVRSLDKAGNRSAQSNPASASPLVPDPELPHYAYDGSDQFACGSCHTMASGGLLPQGFDYRTDPAVCTSCHNATSVAHDSTVQGHTHAMFSDVTASGAAMPTFGAVTAGEYSDTMYAHLKDGRKIVCTTCHNAMRKPNDVGRAWELTAGSGGVFAASRGGWWDRGSQEVRVHRDTLLWTPSQSRDRKGLLVDPSLYVYDRYSGNVALANLSGTYVYFTMNDPYLRAPVPDGTVCSDCHRDESLHVGLDCMFCHRAHETTNVGFVRDSLRTPYGILADVVFVSRTGMGSFADGDAEYDGICEVCHTSTLYHRNDGSGLTNHTSTGMDYSGTDCTLCHTHISRFSR